MKTHPAPTPHLMTRAGIAMVLLLVVLTAVQARAQSSTPQAAPDACGALLAPLRTLHEDLIRIEAKLDSFVRPTWEYKVLTPNVIDENAVDRYSPNLNPLGAQGWELVTYSPDIGYVMKRRIQQPQKDK